MCGGRCVRLQYARARKGRSARVLWQGEAKREGDKLPREPDAHSIFGITGTQASGGRATVL